jgi:hypothetical protein
MAAHPRPTRQRSGVQTATRCVIPQTHRWAGAATPTQRNTTHALDRARRASDVINISNSISEDNPQQASVHCVRPSMPAEAPASGKASAGSSGSRPGRIPATSAGVLLSWLASIPRRFGDRLFATDDTEAYQWGWQITRVHGGLGRRYRDPRFDTLAECPKCQGAGINADVPCVPCLGTGRITIGGVG